MMMMMLTEQIFYLDTHRNTFELFSKVQFLLFPCVLGIQPKKGKKEMANEPKGIKSKTLGRYYTKFTV